MPIYKTPQIELTDERQVATEATLGEAFGAGTYTMYEGLAGTLGRIDDLRQAEGTMPAYRFQRQADGRTTVGKMPLSPLLDPEVARQQLRDNGLDQNLSVPDSGIRQATLDILMSRKKDELRRQQIMSESVGLGGVAANLTGALAGSLVDPTNIALAFVPVVGEARYAQLLARAGGTLGRTGVRLAVGGAEGLVGLAPVEVLNYYAHQQQQSDYDAYDSMLAIAGGAAFGSALHGGAGLFSDVVLGGSRNFAPPGRPEPTLGGVIEAGAAPIQRPGLDMAARERLMVLDRLAEGRPVTRAQAEARLPRTGAEAGQIIDNALAELQQAASRGLLPPERVKALVAESDELAEVLRVQERADRDGVLLAPGSRLTPEERAIADTRRQEIRAELEQHGTAQSAAAQLTKLETKLAKIDSDSDLIRLTEELSPVADDIAFVDGLSPAVRKELDADPFMPVRPFVATLDQKTQASALRMAVAQAMSGRPVDVSPAIYGDAAYLSPDSAFAAANRNANMVDGADQQAADWAASVKPLDDDIEQARATVQEEAQFVKDMMDSTGVEMTASFKNAIDDAELSAKKQGDAAKAAAMCMMRTGG